MTNEPRDYEEYYEEVKRTARTAMIFDLFKKEFGLQDKRVGKDIDYDCYRQSVEWYEKICGMDAR